MILQKEQVESDKYSTTSTAVAAAAAGIMTAAISQIYTVEVVEYVPGASATAVAVDIMA